MSISQFELYHGAVLSQVVRYPKTTLKLIERSDDQSWASYKVMDNSGEYLLYVKYASNPNFKRGDKRRYIFTFLPKDMERIKKQDKITILVCLVCDSEEICLLDENDLDNLGLWHIDKPQTVSVSWDKGCSLTVKKGKDYLSHKIPRNRLRNFKWSR